MKYRLKLRKLELVQGEMIPDFYGIGRHDYARNVIYCYPIPLNVFVRWKEQLKWWVKSGSPLASYVRGYDDGRRFERGLQTIKRIEGITRDSA